MRRFASTVMASILGTPVCLVGLALMSRLSGQQSHEIDTDVLVASLQWFNDWMRPISLVAETSVCEGESTGFYQLLYCSPEKTEVDFWRDSKHGKPYLVTMFSANDLNQVINNASHRFRTWSTAQPVRIVVRRSRLIEHRMIDQTASAKFHETTKAFIEKNDDRRWIGSSVYYPWVHSGDPTYHVYVARDKVIETIWVFNIVHGAVDATANFYYDQPHRNIPEVAEGNLADESKWFQIVYLR